MDSSYNVDLIQPKQYEMPTYMTRVEVTPLRKWLPIKALVVSSGRLSILKLEHCRHTPFLCNGYRMPKRSKESAKVRAYITSAVTDFVTDSPVSMIFAAFAPLIGARDFALLIVSVILNIVCHRSLISMQAAYQSFLSKNLFFPA